MKQKLFDLLPPATLVALLLFWANVPKAWLEQWWLLMVVGFVVIAFVQLLEFLNERHEGWRINKTEFVTDIFYVALGATAISWVTRKLAEEPMTALKESLGLATPWVTTLPFMVQVIMVMLLWEIGQYWMHRLMHNNALFWSTHAPHHHITQLNAMKGYVGNPIELFLISLGIVALFDWNMAAHVRRLQLPVRHRHLCPCQCPRRSADLVFLLLHHHPPPQPAPHGAQL